MAKRILPPDSGQLPTIPDSWQSGVLLAENYLRDPRANDAHTALIVAMQDAVAAGSEAVRGLGETLHKHFAAILQTPDVGTPLVQQQLQECNDHLMVVYDALEAIDEGARDCVEDGAPFGLFKHAAQHGMGVVDLIETTLENIRHHRPSKSTESAVQS